MKHPTEQALEDFLRAADQNAPEQTAVREHLAVCGACSAVLDFLRTMDSAISSTPAVASARVVEFARSLVRRSNVVALRPFEISHPAERVPGEPIVLAAHSPAPDARFRPVASLLSEDESLLLRIIYDADDAVYRLSLLTTDPPPHPLSVVDIPRWEAQCVTDARGQAELPAGTVPEGLPEPDARVHLPVAEVDVEFDIQSHRIHVAPRSGEPDGVTWTLSDTDMILTVEPAEGPSPYSRVVLSEGGVRPRLYDIASGMLRVPLADMSSPLHAGFYI